MNIGCRIIKDFTRPPKELVRQFYDLATSDLDDTMSRFGAVDHSITPLKKYTRSVVGTAFTIRLPHGTTCFFAPQSSIRNGAMLLSSMLVGSQTAPWQAK